MTSTWLGADAGAAAGAGLPFDGLAAGSICVGSSAAVRSSVVAGGQAALAQLGPVADPSSPSKKARQPDSTLSGVSRNRAYNVSTNAGLTPAAISLKSWPS